MSWQKGRSRSRHRLIGFMTLAACLVATGALAEEPLKIRVGWSNANASVIPVGLEKKELMPRNGQTYVVEPVHFQGTPAVVTGLATGDVDIAQLAFSSVAFAILNAKMTDLRVISDVFQDGVDDHFTGPFYVLKDGPVQTIDDLKGKVLADSQVGSAGDIALRAMLRKHHIDDRKDATIIESSFGSMQAVLAQHKADLVQAIVPFSRDPEFVRISRILFTQKEAVGATQMIVWTGRAGFLTRNRAPMVDFLEDSLRLLRYFLDPANHADTVATLASFMKQPPQQFATSFTADDFYRDPDGLPNMQVLQSNLDLQKELGFVGEKINIADYADLSLVREAAQRLGK
jgi:sulfonate transport system substrate-binding protein